MDFESKGGKILFDRKKVRRLIPDMQSMAEKSKRLAFYDY